MWEFDEALAQRRTKLQNAGYTAYCLFCKSGREVALAKELNEGYPECLALPFLRIMHRSRDGERFTEQDVLLKGYAFLYVPAYSDTVPAFGARTGFRILQDMDGMRALEGSNRHYAEWVLSLGGIVGVSKALRVGSRVEIVDGPLLSLHTEGYIAEYSKKNRNCRVQIDLVGNQINAWLPFEWVESKALESSVIYEGDKN